jgi:HD-GYP domain-containing protein (c-di-GMP phosphodiesterase class II)
LRRRARDLEVLTAISAQVNSSLDILVVLNQAMESAEQLFDAERSSIWEIDPSTRELFTMLFRGQERTVVGEIRLKPGEGIAGWVAQHGEPVIVPDVASDERWAHRIDEMTEFQTRSILCVPLRSRERIVGALQLLNKRGGETFSEDDLELATILGNQIAIAVDNARLYQERHRTFINTAKALASAIEKRDKYTGGHTRRVVDYSLAVGRAMGLSPEECNQLEVAAILHDIGKIGVSDDVLNKGGELTDDEFEQMRKHPLVGAEIIEHVPQLQGVVAGILYHHERLDGQGYPMGLAGGDIPLMARIIAVADAFDAMTTDRPYRGGLSADQAIHELEKGLGTQFDRAAVAALVNAYRTGEVKLETELPSAVVVSERKVGTYGR